jgi:hypothetical protein
MGGPAVPGELDQAAAIDAEERDDLMQTPLDPAIEIDGRQTAEVDRQRRQELLQTPAVGERELHPPALQRAGERLAQQTQALNEVVRPRAFTANGVEGQDAEHGATGTQRKRDVRTRAGALVARAIDRRRRRQLIDAGESDDGSAPQLFGRPRELAGVRDLRQRLDTRCPGGDPRRRPAVDRGIEIPAIDAQERDDLPEPALERRVEIGGRHVNEPGRQLGQQCLEPQALLQEQLRPPA